MTIKILVVDDEPAVLQLTKQFLEKDTDISVTTSDSSDNARQLMNREEFDVIISDYQMPDQNGIDFLKSIRKSGNRVPFIIFTGKGREEVAIEALNSGADAYIQKGGKPEAQFADLLSVAKALAEKRRTQNEFQNIQNRLKNFIDNLPAFVSLKDLDGRYIGANKMMCELVGKSESEILGKRVEELLPKELAEKTRKGDEEVVRTGGIVFLESHDKLQDRAIDVAVTKIPLRDSTGKITAIATFTFDISYVKQMEKAFHQQEKMLADVFECIPDGICILDKEMNVIHANPAMYKIYPPMNPPVVGAKCYYAFDGKSSRCADCNSWRALEKGEIIREKIYRRNPDDTDKWIEVFHFPLIDPETNTPQGVILYLRDITQKHITERALSEEDKFISEIFSSIQDGISILDKNLNILKVNAAMERWYAHALPLVGKRCYEAYHGRSAPCETCPTRRTLETGNAEYNIVPKTGPAGEVVGWLDLYSFPIRNPTTIEIEGVIEYVRDVTDREKIKAAFEESQQQFVSIFDSIDEPIYVSDPETYEILYGNQAIKENFGDVIGKKCYKMFQGLDQPCSFCTNDKIFGENVGQSYIWEFQNKATKRWYRCTDRAIIWPDGRLVRYEMAIDITDRKLAEEHLKQANMKLSILGNITKHDTYNQLATIQGYVDFIRNASQDKSVLQYLDKITNASFSIQRQFEFVTDYQNVGIKNPEWINVSAVFSRVSDNFDLDRISVKNEINDIEVFADPMIEKVFHNLIDNSIKHGKTVTEIGIRGGEMENGYRIQYYDNGVGFSPESKNSLFKTKIEGKSGFGLYLARQILAITGLSIDAAEEGEIGAHFEINVPIGKYRIRSGKSNGSSK